MLVLSSEHSVSHIKVLCSLLECHWLHIATDLEIEVAHANCALSEHHIDCLSDCAIALIFELRINRESNLCLCKFSLGHIVCYILKLNDVSGTILEPEEQTWPAFVVCGEVLFAYDVTNVLGNVANAALVTCVAHSVRK